MYIALHTKIKDAKSNVKLEKIDNWLSNCFLQGKSLRRNYFKLTKNMETDLNIASNSRKMTLGIVNWWLMAKEKFGDTYQLSWEKCIKRMTKKIFLNFVN